ncbi:MAG: hypothetical protein IJP49_03880 [Bacteroidales bacterium]|nr:hypothetical protein [Bacteroidales bacterium]
MKKSLYFGIAALAALAFSACQKEVAVNEPSKKMVTVTLKAEKPGDETRTAAVEEESKVSYEWTDEDKANLKVFVVGEDAEGKETLTEVADRVVNLSEDNKVLTVTATVEEGSTLRTAVAGAWTNKNKPKINVNQSPKVDNLDPNADVLVAEDVTVDELEDALLDFSRPAAINKMTLKNMVAGEKVHEITITSDKNLIGYYNGSTMSEQSDSKTITLTYDNVAVGSNGEFPVYFVTMPQEGNALTVVVKSDQFVYTKSFGTVNFSIGKFSRFGVKLAAGEPVVDVDFTGDWVITGENNGSVYAAQAFVSGGSNLRALSVGLDEENEEITSSNVEGIKMHFEKVAEGDYAGLYTIQDASGNYLYAASATANQLKGNPTLGGVDYYWSVEKEQDGTFAIKASKSTNRNVMQFNSGSSLFSCYSSASQKPVTLYPFDWVVEDAGAQPSGTGTLEDPYNALGAANAVKDLKWNSNSDYETTDDVYVKGKISRIANNGTYTAGGTYGNASFYISDDGAASNEFYCFRVLYLGNKKFESGQTDIRVGDEVIVYGKLMNYQGNTPETVGNKAYLYSLNGVTGDEEEPELVSIAITTAPTKTTFTVGDTFVFDGKVTASYDDGSTKDVTSKVTTDGDSVIASAGENKTVTVSYTENDVTKTATYTVTVNEAGDAIQFSWERDETTDVVTSGYVFNAISAKSASGYYQDKSSTEGLEVTITKSDESAIFSTTPASITLSAKVGGGSARELTNNVMAYLIDEDGNIIEETATVVTSEVTDKNGTIFSVSIPVAEEAYGIRIAHEKESSYNVRLFSVAVTIVLD